MLKVTGEKSFQYRQLEKKGIMSSNLVRLIGCMVYYHLSLKVSLPEEDTPSRFML